MAGWSMVADGCAADRSITLENLEKSGFPFEIDLGFKGLGEKSKFDSFRRLFDEFLLHFLKKIYARDARRSPPMLENGERLDLLKLLSCVKEKGCDAVSENGLWDMVAEELGLGLFASSAVKLAFAKYLDILVKWLTKGKNSEGGLMAGSAFSSGFLTDVKEFGDLISGISEQGKKDDEYPDLDLAQSNLSTASGGTLFGNDCKNANDKNESSCLLSSEGSKRCGEDDNDVCCSVGLNGGSNMCSDNDSDVGTSVAFDGGSRCAEKEAYLWGCKYVSCKVGSSIGLDGEDIYDDDNDEDVSVLDPADADKVKLSRKRKRSSFIEMLNWLTHLAKDPGDPSNGMLTGTSEFKYTGAEEYWKQALLAREALFFIKPAERISGQSILQKKHKMHPSMYEERVGSGPQSERTRCSLRLQSLKESQWKACADSSSSSPQTESSNSNPAAKKGGTVKKGFLRTDDSLTGDSMIGLAGNDHIRKRVPLGPSFQAKVPQWTGMASESDSKWLGTRIWPSENCNSKFLIERERIGKGRQETCGCQVPNSAECVRFHVELKRMRLKLELGMTFYSWNFDKMGEEIIALSWTEDDKRRFDAAVRSNPPSQGITFWDDVYEMLPSKSREELVSYYYNVYLLQRRAYQNRFTPTNINSDDDDEDQYEIGSSTNGFRHQ